MKIETPQILWHNGSQNDNGKNAPILSLSLLKEPVSLCENGDNGAGTQNENLPITNVASIKASVLATGGNTAEVNLWTLTFRHHDDSSPPPPTSAPSRAGSPQKPQKANILQQTSSTNIVHLLTLTRSDRSVNSVSFSPSGSHLLTAGDGGTLIVYSAALPGARAWSSLEKENDLHCRILNPHTDDIMSTSWSPDSKRFVVGSLDHTVLVYEDANHKANTGGGNSGGESSAWKCVWRSTRDHTHYVQGVTYDPLGAYLCSMGSDRTVKVWSRKDPASSPRNKKKGGGGVLTPSVSSDPNAADKAAGLAPSAARGGEESKEERRERHRRKVQLALTEGKFEVAGKARTLKYRQSHIASPTSAGNNADLDNRGDGGRDENAPPAPPPQPGARKHHLYADESTVESFFRRLSFTTDGAYLVTPAALWHGRQGGRDEEKRTTALGGGETNNTKKTTPTFATYLWARHRFDRPCRVLSGLEKPSVVIRPNPVLFRLPKSTALSTKENQTTNACGPATLAPTALAETDRPTNTSNGSPPQYRSVFAVLTLDTILIYDTYHLRPLAVARGLHFAGLTDCDWTSDGLNLVVSSTDGYVSIVTFREGELGEVYRPKLALVRDNERGESPPEAARNKGAAASPTRPPQAETTTAALIPPCEPGQTASIVAPPAKRLRRIAPTLVSSSPKPLPVPGSSEAYKAPSAGTKRAIESTAPPGSSGENAICVDDDDAHMAENNDRQNHNKITATTTETEVMVDSVTKLSLAAQPGETQHRQQQQQPKKKKRIQPTLVSLQ